MDTHRSRARARLGLALALAGCGADGAGLTLAVDEDVGPRRADGAADTPTTDAAPSGGAVPPADAAVGAGDASSPTSDAQADALPPPADAATGAGLTAVTLDLSTLNLADPIYLRHVSSQPYEDFLGAALRALDADLVALQGLLPSTVCATANEVDPTRTCFEANLRPTQAERLLGPDYQIVCDGGRETTCLGVHTRLGGLPPTSVPATSAPPLPPCSVGANTCDDAHCDEDSAVTQIGVTGPTGPLSVVFFMLSGAGRGAGGFYTGQTCRAAQVDQLFEAAALAPEAAPLLLGDLAFDPESLLAGAAGDRLATHVAPVGPFTDHAPREANGRRSPTELSVGNAQDTLLTRGTTTRCEALGAPEFDADFDFAQLAGGTEDRGRITHRPVRCRVTFGPEN